LKRTIGYLYPELFLTPTTPKKAEIAAELPMLRGMDKEKAARAIVDIKGNEEFELMLLEALAEIYRVLKPGGIALIVYAHKSLQGWESLLNSLLESDLVITAAWPIRTERGGRLTAQGTASLASSIYIVTRKILRQSTGIYSDVRQEMKKHLSRKLDRIYTQDAIGVDFFIAAIGFAIEVFGKYSQVIDYEGKRVRADRLLQIVRELATDYVIHKIFKDSFSKDISALTKFYVLFRWYYKNAKIHFDEARKLAQSCGIDIAMQWGKKSFIMKEKEFIRILGPQERKIEDFEEDMEMIDVLHYVLHLWKNNRRNEIAEILNKSGFARNDAFWHLARAIAETLPLQNREKKLLDGLLAGRESYTHIEEFLQESLE
jgi:adenine-specific DNA methylase